MAGILSDASDERRGVRLRTVIQFPFESSAGETKTAGNSFLNSIRNLSDNLRVREDNAWFGKLCELLKFKVAVGSSSVQQFEEICEGFVSLLYFSLVFNKEKEIKEIKTIFRHFVDKWFFGFENFDFNQLVLDIDKLYQTSSFATVLLLYSHHDGTLLNTKSCEFLLKWRTPNSVTPPWLTELLSTPKDAYENLNMILCKSLNYGCVTEIDIKREYLKSLATFLDATYCYKSEKYDESIQLLSSINDTNCGQFLMGWCKVICGLNLEKLGKHQSALLKYKEAINVCSDCFHALYYVARVLEHAGATEAQLECLKLLSLVKVENLKVDSSIQRTVISYLLPSLNHLSLRVTWLLAATYFSCKKWKESREQFYSVLGNWDECVEVPSTCKERVLVPRSDEIPELPSRSCVKLGLVSCLMCLKEYEDVEFELKGENVEGTSLDNFEKVSTKEKIEKYSTILCEQVLSEALYRDRKFDEALAKCGRLLVWLETIHGSDSNWVPLLLLTKAYVYKLLSLLYTRHRLDLKENCIYFTRLQDHCLKLAETEEQELISPNKSYELFFRNTKMFLVERIKELH